MMLRLAVIAVLVAVVLGDYTQQFAAFKAAYGRRYASASEEAKRFAIFVQNMQTAATLQATNPQATFGVNEFADVSAVEFKMMHNGQAAFAKVAGRAGPEPIKSTGALPPSIDWRARGAVTYIKNQGQCGSCWSFSTTGNIEGQWFLAGHKLVAVSEQELVSCDTIDSGCNGGLMDNAFNWLVQNRNGKIVTEASYPYVSGDGSVPACSPSQGVFGAQISGHHDIAHDELTMATVLGTNGPIAIAVDATSFQTYTGGILSNCQSQQLDHGVLLVGFEGTGSTPYWIVKNSWGPSWGEAGYIRIAYGSNQCLINNYPTTSIVNKSGPAPPPPPPGPSPSPAPPGPTPPPPPPSATFTQKVCQDPACSQGCSSNTFPQNACLQLEGGGSAIATCYPDYLEMKVFVFSQDCTGFSIPEQNPVNQCAQDSDGTYFENICSSGASAAQKALKIPSVMSRKLQRLRKH